jgi:hypothetical protein
VAEHRKPQKSIGDVAHALAKSVISQTPIVGAPAAEIFALVVTPPYERRRDEWIENIGNGLKELAEEVEGFKIEELSQNEAFITTVTHASQVAIRNHQKEKLEALRNAVLNAALPNAPEEDLQLMFLTYIDSLTTWHLAILSYLNDPREWGNRHGVTYPEWHMGGVSTGLEHAFPELRGKQDTYDVFVKDLHSRGLIRTDSLHTTVSGGSILASLTSTLGKQFIQFITTPSPLQNVE